MTVLGSGWVDRPPLPAPPEPDRIEEMVLTVVRAVAEIRDAIASMPVPEVHVGPADLSQIVTAVNGLKPGADAEDIGRAVAKAIHIPEPADPTGVLAELRDALSNLDFRLKGVGGPAFGASGPSNISDNPSRRLGVVESVSAPVDVSDRAVRRIGVVESVSAPVDVSDRAGRLLGTVTQSPTYSLKVTQGKVRLYGTKLSLGLAAPNGSMLVSNPAGNTRSVTVAFFVAETDAAIEVTYFSGASSTGAVVAGFNPGPSNVSAPFSHVVRAGVGVLSGGTLLSLISRLSPSDKIRQDGPFVILPGETLALRAINAAAATNVYLNVGIIEE